MKTDFRHSRKAVKGFLVYSRVAGVLLLLSGLSAYAAWSMGATLLPAIGGSTMRPTAALCFLFSGISLLLAGFKGGAARALAVSCSAVVALLGLDGLFEHLFVGLIGLAGWLDSIGAGVARGPALMAKLAACGFILQGVQGMLASLRRGLVLREMCALGTLAIAMIGMASFAFVLAQRGVPILDEFPIMTSGLLLLAALGWMSALPTSGLTRVATAATLGGVFARRLLLPTLLLPVLIAFVFKTLEVRFGVPPPVASGLAALFTGGTLAWMTWMVATLLDRSERQQMASLRLQNEVGTDALTGLGNRRRFDVVLEELILRHQRRAEPFTLLLLDVDFFKAYNDTYGHQAGDAALCAVGRLIRDSLRPGDLAARYGGEEFAVLLRGVCDGHAPVVAARIREAIRRHPWPHRPLTVSIGAAEVRAEDSGGALLERADRALYQAKRNGRDRVEHACRFFGATPGCMTSCSAIARPGRINPCPVDAAASSPDPVPGQSSLLPG